MGGGGEEENKSSVFWIELNATPVTQFILCLRTKTAQQIQFDKNTVFPKKELEQGETSTYF